MIKILHGADLHLDSPFSSYPPREGAKYRAMQRQLPERLVTLANQKNCQLLLLAGDVFDSGEVHPETLQALVSALAAFRGHVFIAPGNHDPYTPQSVWAQTSWPENVHIFKEAYDSVLLPELGCRVHGGAFFSQCCDVPVPKVEKQGYVDIGVFHGECAAGSMYRAVTKAQIEQSGLDYLALGHIHKLSFPRLLAGTWFGWPGVTMSRGFDEPGECGVLYVQLQGKDCAAEFISMENPTHEILTVSSGAVPEILPGSEQIHCRMCFVGQSEPVDVQGIYRKYAPHYLSLEILDETEPVPDLWAACGDGSLRGLALDVLKESGDELAAAYLIAALEGREEP